MGRDRQRQASLRRRRRRRVRRDEQTATNLQELLASELGCVQFAAHLQGELAQENLMFWREIRQCPEAMPLQQADDIVRKFVSCGGENQVNISAAQRERIEAGVEHAHQIDATVPRSLFAEAQQEVFIMMSGSFVRFKHQQRCDCVQTSATATQQGNAADTVTTLGRLRRLSNAWVASLSVTMAAVSAPRSRSHSELSATRTDERTAPLAAHTCRHSFVLKSAERKFRAGVISQAEYHHILDCERRFMDLAAAAVAADISLST